MRIEQAQTKRSTNGHLRLSVINHFRSIVSFYISSQRVEIESCFPLLESMQRLLALNEVLPEQPHLSPHPSVWDSMNRFLGWRDRQPEVYVHVSKRNRFVKNPFRKETGDTTTQPWLKNRITIGSAHQSGRSNLLHLFTGKFEENGGRCTLRGEIGIDPGIRFVLGVFCFAMFIFIPITSLVRGSFLQGAIFMLGFGGMLELVYSFGKNDAAKILRNLRGALVATSVSTEPTEV